MIRLATYYFKGGLVEVQVLKVENGYLTMGSYVVPESHCKFDHFPSYSEVQKLYE